MTQHWPSAHWQLLLQDHRAAIIKAIEQLGQWVSLIVAWSGVENDGSRAHIGGMPREKYESLLKCPMCDRAGLAEMSDEKSNLGDFHTRIEAVPEGFEIKGDDVICSACQVSAL